MTLNGGTGEVAIGALEVATLTLASLTVHAV